MPPLMPGGEVAAGRAEHDDVAAGHVLAAVVADALDHGVRARVPHGEPLAGEPAEERLAPRRAVEDGVADDHVLLGGEGRALGRPDRDRPAGEALAGVVVRVAAERQLDAGREPRAERLPGRAAQREPDRPLGQPLGAAGDRDRVREEPADGAVHVPDRAARPRPASRPRSPPPRARSAPSRAPTRAASPAPASGGAASRAARRAACSRFERSIPRAFQWSTASSASSRSTRPIRSSKRAIPSSAMIARASSATKKKKLTTCSGVPGEARAQHRDPGSRSPTGHVFRWQARIITQPVATAARSRSPSRRRRAARRSRRRGRS